MISADLYLHGQEDVPHDDAVQVQEADDAGHPKVAGLGPEKGVDDVEVVLVHLILLCHARLPRKQLPGSAASISGDTDRQKTLSQESRWSILHLSLNTCWRYP